MLFRSFPIVFELGSDGYVRIVRSGELKGYVHVRLARVLVVPVVVPNGGGFRYKSTTGQSNHMALTLVPNFQFQTTSDLLDR